MKKVNVCIKCVLPESPPDIFFNEDGVCNICVEHEKIKKDGQKDELLESDLIKILNKYDTGKKYMKEI